LHPRSGGTTWIAVEVGIRSEFSFLSKAAEGIFVAVYAYVEEKGEDGMASHIADSIPSSSLLERAPAELSE